MEMNWEKNYTNQFKQLKMKKAPAKMKKKAAMKMKKAPAKFNAKLKKASADGKLKGEFKAAVDASPAQMKKAAMKMKKESMAMLKKSTMMMKKAAMKMKMKKK